MTFDILPDGDDQIPSPDEGWVYCKTCDVDREIANLDNNTCCAQCGSVLIRDPDEELALAELAAATLLADSVKRSKKSSTNDPTSSADEVAAFKLPFQPPTPFINSDAVRELASRALCRRRLLPFIQKFRPKYDAGWVHADICTRLEKFVQDVADGKEPRLLLMMPPRAGKSEIGSRHLPAWTLGNHPDWEIIAASHTSSLTMSFSRYVRDLVRDPVYSAIFPGTTLDPASQSVENWNILGTGGGYLAAGVGTGITGRGAHILLLDDLVKDMEAADSQTIRDNTWEWYVSTAYTRLAPGGGVIGIMTWWHDDDWAGRIQRVMDAGEGDKFEIIKYPAINDKGDEYRLPNGIIHQVVPELEDIPDGAVLTRTKGTALHPARYTTNMMLRIKANMFASGQQRVWNSLYQQNPMPEDGIFFTKQMMRTYSSLPARNKCHVYQAWDFAITESTSADYTVGVTIYQDEHDTLYVADVVRFRSGDGIFIVDQILDYALQWDATLLGFEDGQIWRSIQSTYDKRVVERKQYGHSYDILKPLTDKMVRASPLRGRMQQGKVYFDDKAPWYRELFAEMTRFPAGKNDDQIDALSWCVRLSLLQSAPKPLVRNDKVKSWKEKVKAYVEATSNSHMSA